MLSLPTILAVAALSVSLAVPPVPLVALDPGDPPGVTAPSWVLYDETNDVVLAEAMADAERSPASVTKVMTALVVRDHTESDDLVLISTTAAATGEAEIGVYPGELWTVEDLLAAMMVRSGNDAAVALAEHVGGSVEGFAAMMNDKAAALGLAHSHFVNPHGLDHPDHYSSARDQLTIALAALDDPVLARLVRTKVVAFRKDPNGIPRRAVNTNRLLGAYPGVIGVKTGFTGQAGRVLVAAAEQGGRTLVSVVMGSDDHFEDTRQLLEWGFDTFDVGDRAEAALLVPFGGGGTSAPPVRLAPDVERRLRAMPELPRDSGTGSRVATPLELEIAEFLRGAIPVTVGGTP